MSLQPDNTAIRTALWRAMHVLTEAPPYIIDDTIGLDLVRPEKGWQERPDMKYTKRLRASIVARARYIEDAANEWVQKGISQYVLLGAGLDSFAQRNPQLLTQLTIYEIDQPKTIEWKKQMLLKNGYSIPTHLRFVPVNFEKTSWWDELLNNGFDKNRPAFISCTGVTLYLTKEAIRETLKKMSLLAPGSALAIAFYLPLNQLDEEDQQMQERANKGAEASGTPFISFLSVEEVASLAHEAGLENAQVISTVDLTKKYFENRSDHFIPASGEVFLIAEI